MSLTAHSTATRTARPSFYLWMVVICAAVAILGFAPTYWAPVARGTFRGSALMHIHGLVFFGWTLFVVYQTTLVPARRVARHREMGLVGVSLASVMTVLGVTVGIVAARQAIAAGFDAQAKTFLIVPLAGILFFAVVFAAAIAQVRRPEWHKRLILVATISILEAPVARPFMTYLAPADAPPGPPPVAVVLPSALIADLLIVAAMAYDWRTRGRPHAAYAIAGGALLLMQLVREPVSATVAWGQVATWLVGIAG